ncbi:lipopolysaccharide biosynthesis protein [Kineosporia sp. R_H_3]|uniref:lipopolysaccharide biosynthesis protein n=1 Tax=Kineosporia sp. R_H_3 TaxID=1961848 RepID=UPI000B4B1EA0|nr:lipopolysaccharide biosynthesis protein [Kineosporia sp. R_H_3]
MSEDLRPAVGSALAEPVPAGPGDLQRQAAGGALWTMIHVVVAVPLAFAANAVVARTLGVTDYGRLAVLGLALSIATSVTNLGVSDGVIQWGAAAHSRADQRTVDSLLRRSLGFHAFVQLPLLTIFVLLATRDQSWLVRAALLVSVAVPAMLGSSTLALTIENRTAMSAKIAIVSNAVTQAAVAATAVVGRSPEAVWAARNTAGALLLPANLLALTPSRRRAALTPQLPKGMPSGFWRFGLFSAAGGLLGMLVFSRSELLVLQGFGAVQAAGIFALAFGLAQQVTAPVDALLGPLQPAVAGVVESHPDRAKETLMRTTRVSSLLCGGVAVIALPLLFGLVPLIYGRSFEPAAAVFLALGLISCFRSAVNPLMTFTRARKRAGALLGINAAALAVDLVVAVVCIPTVGLWGAVVANTAGQAAALGMLVRYECRAWDIGTARYLAAMSPLFLSAAAAPLGPVLLALGAPAAVSALGGVGAIVLVVALIRVTGQRVPMDDLRPAVAALPRVLRKPVTAALRAVATDPSECRGVSA